MITFFTLMTLMFDSGEDTVGRNYMLVTFGGWTVSIWPVYYPPSLGIQELLVSPRYLCCLPWSFQWSLLYIPTIEKTSVLLQHWEWDQKVQHYSRRELCVPLSECIATGKEWRYWKWMTGNQSSLKKSWNQNTYIKKLKAKNVHFLKKLWYCVGGRV